MAVEMHLLLAWTYGWAAQSCSRPTEIHYELGTTLLQLSLQILALSDIFLFSDKTFPTATMISLLCGSNNLQVI